MENIKKEFSSAINFIVCKNLVSRKNQDGTVIVMKLDDSSIFYKMDGAASIIWSLLQTPTDLATLQFSINQIVIPILIDCAPQEIQLLLKDLAVKGLIENTTLSLDSNKSDEVVISIKSFNGLQSTFGAIKEFDLAQIESEVLNNSIYLDVFAGSDMRLKSNMAPLQNSLNKVLSLEGISFFWNDLAKSNSSEAHDQANCGLVAQQVAEKMPELVRKDSNSGFLTVNYTKMIPYLVESIKDLNAELVLQRDKITQLQVELKNIRN